MLAVVYSVRITRLDDGAVVLECPLHGAPADAEDDCQLWHSFAFVFKQGYYLAVTAVLEQTLPAPGLIVDAAGEGAVQAGLCQLTAFVLVLAVFRHQVRAWSEKVFPVP